MEKQLKVISKLMSLVLRHQPEFLNMAPDANGWVNVQELIEKINAKEIIVDLNIIETIVADNDKRRFVFNDDKTMIRAQQGHSFQVDLELKEVLPPVILYHGTARENVDSILLDGLCKQQRHHVHLSVEKETAKAVGSRHGKPVVLIIDAKRMTEAGFIFYLSGNGVWLVDAVPKQYISL